MLNRRVGRWVLGLALLVAIALALTFREHLDAAALETWVQGAGVAGPLLFISLYALATVLFFPGPVEDMHS